MSKTIAITPSWYWPAGVPRVAGVPPFRVDELAVTRWARRSPGEPALVSGERRLSWGDLAEEVATRASTLSGQLGVAPPADDLFEGALTLLAALAADTTVQLGDSVAPGERPADLRAPSIALPATGADAWLSQRALLAGSLGLGTFYSLAPATTWVTTFGPESWKGLYGLVAPLVAGSTVVVSEPGAPALEAVRREGATWLYTDLEGVFGWSREAKREVKSVRGALASILACVDGPFDPEQRRRVSRTFETAALTLFGMAETGPVFASHASWYLDEAVGIPLTNVHVVPADPRTGAPISALWELVESAMVTVAGPSLFCGYRDRDDSGRLSDGRFATAVMASSDPNGMVYLLPS